MKSHLGVPPKREPNETVEKVCTRKSTSENKRLFPGKFAQSGVSRQPRRSRVCDRHPFTVPTEPERTRLGDGWKLAVLGGVGWI